MTPLLNEPPMDWSPETITDSVYREKFIQVPRIIADWLEPYGGFANKNVLDFGCGEATMALAIALAHGARRVVAVDTHAEIDNCSIYARDQLGMTRLPSNLELNKVRPSDDLADFGPFDVIYSWSVFEHVSQELLEASFKKLRRALAPHGVMFLQTTPLYYSAWGAHLRPFVPEPWCHLTMQQSRLYEALRSKTQDRVQADHLQEVYETLNRATAPDLIGAAETSGFKIARKYLTFDDMEIPPELLQIYTRDVLTTAQLVFLAEPAW